MSKPSATPEQCSTHRERSGSPDVDGGNFADAGGAEGPCYGFLTDEAHQPQPLIVPGNLLGVSHPGNAPMTNRKADRSRHDRTRQRTATYLVDADE